MGILNGKINLKVCKIDSSPFKGTEDLLAAAAVKAAPPLELASSLVRTSGLASGKILLSTEINEENSLFGDTILLNIRRTGHNIDNGMLKALIQRAEAEYLEQTGNDYVPRAMRKKIREEKTEVLSVNALLTVKGIEFAITNGLVLVASNSQSDIDLVMETLIKDLNIIAHPITYISGNAGVNCRRRFLTWLYTKQSDSDLGVDVFIDGPLELIAEDDKNDDKVVCCTKAKIEGDLVTKSEELDQMLREKKFLRKAKVTITKNDRVWRFAFNADAWTFGSLELPMEDRDEFENRIASIYEFSIELEKLFNQWKIETELALGEQRLPFAEKE